MTLYDDLIRAWDLFLTQYEVKRLPVRDVSWPDAGNDNMVFLSDTAVELGGERRFSKSAMTVTENEELLGEDEILLAGPDLSEIRGSAPFARLTTVLTGPGLGRKENEENASSLYGAIRSIELTRYHVNPEGYMLRISAGKNTEAVRISRDAVKKGIDFTAVGNMYRRTLHKNKLVRAVRTVFVTEPSVDFESLGKLMKKASDITRTLDHISDRAALMDCHTCSLQEICDEVEGLRELHFKDKGK